MSNNVAASGDNNSGQVLVDEASRRSSDEELESEREELKYGARHFIKLFLPICATMLLVVLSIRFVIGQDVVKNSQGGGGGLAGSFSESSTDTGDAFVSALLNVAILLGAIIVMTFLLVALYKYRCYCILTTWVWLATMMILFLFVAYYCIWVTAALNIPVDAISLIFLVLQIGAIGVISLHFDHLPLVVSQCYLVMISVLMACILIKALPPFTTWLILGMLVLWDCVAVLCPFGPLRKLIEIAQDREDNNDKDTGFLKAILYSTTMVVTVDENGRPVTTASNERQQLDAAASGDNQPTSSSLAAATAAAAETRNTDERRRTRMSQDRGVKLGLGDFVFYSLLIGRSSVDSDLPTTIACFIAILFGLCCTLILLAVFKKALPALPISITLGLIFYFSSSLIISPFLQLLNERLLII